MEANKTNSIVNLATLEASTNKDILANIAKALATVENSAFKVVVNSAYLMGDSIPYLDGTLTIAKDRKVAPKAVYGAIGKSKATISRWRKALKYIIENGLFNDFNNKVYPFSFDKVIMIFDNDLVTEERDFATLMSMTVTEIEKLYKADTDSNGDADSESNSDADADTDSNANYASGTIVEFTFDGKTFKVDGGVLKHFIETECTMG